VRVQSSDTRSASLTPRCDRVASSVRSRAVKVDRYPTDAAANLEGIDAVVEEVAEELRPCALLLAGRVPHSRLGSSVVAARSSSGIRTRHELVRCAALMPVFAAQPSSRCSGDCAAETHTYEPSTKAAAALRTSS
jgi:hypothetical protein